MNSRATSNLIYFTSVCFHKPSTVRVYSLSNCRIFGRRAEAGSRSNVPSRLFHDPQSVPSTSNPTPDLVSATALARPDSTSTPGIDEADFDGISRSPNVIGGEGGAKEGEQALGRTSGIEDLLREAYEMRSAAIERPLSRLDRSRY